MIKTLLLILPMLAFANETATNRIIMDHARMKPLGKIVRTNAQITQLSDQKQKIVSRLPGHVEKYFVTTGQHVKAGDKVVLIESIALSKMSADYVALRQQAKAAREQLATARKLYKKGLTSQNELNQKIIEIEEVLAQQSALASQLDSLGIDAEKLKSATDQFILRAHADGVVGEIFVPLHSNVNAEDPLMSIVNQSAYYAIAYLDLNDAMKVTPKTTGFIRFAGKQYPAHFVQLLPTIDKETQRAKVLFMMMNSPRNILINAFTEMDISLEPYRNALMIKKSALSLFQGEWVVFVEAHKSEKAHGHNKKEEEAKEHEEIPYLPEVVKIIAYYGDDVAIEGLDAGEAYVSAGVYFVKSMLLKSSIGDGD
ncbi:efflux RND transporter periplasmic adaptor subunit [Sulfurovum sp.]|uniref:efflux RND transporter periplasmic adaptor subunit n=1 Tax=Sulfurovum sp. TaxID=1969726 RepID=UPI0025FF45B8|nr:efflux RND transporter periplasmic adaptor subunit [Sulfurovum sp.]